MSAEDDPMPARFQRGSTLIVSLLVMVILTVIGVAMVRFAAREQAGARSSSRQAALIACARAAARVLTSQFGVGVGPSGALDIFIGDPTDPESIRIVGGHFDQDPSVASIEIEQVTMTRPGAFSGNQRGVVDLTNRIVAFEQRLGPQQVVAHCQIGDKSGPSTGRQVEVELNLRKNL
jgi:hypothetical protein